MTARARKVSGGGEGNGREGTGGDILVEGCYLQATRVWEKVRGSAWQ